MHEKIREIVCLLKDDSTAVSINTQVVTLLESCRDLENPIYLVLHPLGFLLGNFGTVDEQYSLRIHIWDSKGERQDLNSIVERCGVHNHMFSFTSHVLCGSISNHEFDVESSSQDSPYELYEVEYEGSYSVMKSIGELVRCNFVKTTSIIRGGRYQQEARVFHATTASHDTLTATILITDNFKDYRPKVVGPSGGLREFRFHRERLPDSETRLVLQSLRGQITNQ